MKMTRKDYLERLLPAIDATVALYERKREKVLEELSEMENNEL